MAQPASSTAPRRVVEAAGAVVWRTSTHDQAEVLLVHRPKYDDWSFPKGKLLPGEQAPAAAVREVEEETGVRIRLCPPLPAVRYPLTGGADKVVRYWSAVPADPDAEFAFTPNHEVDQCGWFRLGEAVRYLTHPRDRSLLTRLVPGSTRAFILLRHASAVARTDWQEPDAARPLDDAGVLQSERLGDTLAAYAIRRVVSSPARRGVDTVRPYAASQGLDIETEPAFEEEADPVVVREHTRHLLDSAEATVLCTHRPTLPAIFEALSVTPVTLRPGELVVLHLSDRVPVAVERQPSGEAGSGDTP
ncbi:NUDIX hydrolase [Actinopolymorpha alba]|uniref:NUDIX hydrolase n=1 Tax=Actinopolymorpha alba TaxID=533267 RepID=UPI0003789A22|nr:NUDIX hydrolase [Actinopolymorpha alba]